MKRRWWRIGDEMGEMDERRERGEQEVEGRRTEYIGEERKYGGRTEKEKRRTKGEVE